jgi:hypothetical protein
LVEYIFGGHCDPVISQPIRRYHMSRQDITAQIEKAFGFVPGWLVDMPDQVLDQYWSNLSWLLSDTKLSARDKALVSFGAATAIHCPY